LDNSDNTNESTAPLCQTVDQGIGTSQPEGEAQAHEVVIVGTAHVSEKSVQDVTLAIEKMKPDIVAVELCPARYRALTGQEEEQEIKISELLSGGKIYFVLVQWFLAYIQKRIG
jgi:pheromone shutdown protein TraB